MKSKLILILAIVPILTFAKPQKQNTTTAVFYVSIVCDNCVKNIQNNISFEKGLKDMVINKKAQTVTLTWDNEKTDTTKLKTAFEKIHKPVSKIEIQQTAEK